MKEAKYKIAVLTENSTTYKEVSGYYQDIAEEVKKAYDSKDTLGIDICSKKACFGLYQKDIYNLDLENLTKEGIATIKKLI